MASCLSGSQNGGRDTDYGGAAVVEEREDSSSHYTNSSGNEDSLEAEPTGYLMDWMWEARKKKPG